jgi:signal transduction histidine kinase
VNQDVINFGRHRVQSVITFRDSTTQVQSAFAIAGFTLVLLTLVLLYDIALYLRQIEEAETARQSNRFKDQFLAVMSHELRTPLNAIIGFLGIMKMQGSDSAKLPHMIDRSRANAERLLSLIDDILDISKIEAGKFEIHPEEVVIRDVVNRWRAQTEILAQQKGLEFECLVDDTIPNSILVDVDTISKVATNLLSNALKFTEKGSVKLEIQAFNNEWRIRVTDTGIGIPEDKRDIIFQSFRQVDGSIRRNFGGSGLGLSIVKQLTELMGGRVEVESKEGSGSSFTVTLPLVATPTPAGLESALRTSAVGATV